MVELEGQGKRRPEKPLPVPAPDEEGVVVAACVNIYRAVDFRLGQGGSADDHIVPAQVEGGAGVVYLSRQAEVVPVKIPETFGEGDIAGADNAILGRNHRIDRYFVILYQFIANRQEIELLHGGRSPADAPAEQHVGFEAVPAADSQKPGNIQGFEDGHHRHGSLHPQCKGRGAAGFLWIDFTHDGDTLLFSLSFRGMCYIRVCIPPAGRSGKGSSYTTLFGMPQGKLPPEGQKEGRILKIPAISQRPIVRKQIL